MKKLPHPITIYSASSYSEAIDESETDTKLTNLKKLVQEKAGVSIRRVGRFIQLSLIGAGDCINQKTIPVDTAVYLSSENGDMETTISVLRSMYVDKQPPKPLSFINTVSNAACFYVANTFNLTGESSFMSTINFAFEQTLLSAVVDLSLQRVPAALVGTVDICNLPLAEHRVRIRAPMYASRSSDKVMGEGSHWLLLSLQDSPPIKDSTVLAKLVSLENHASLEELIKNILLDEVDTVIALGQHLSEKDKKQIIQSFSKNAVWHYTDSMPFYNSQSASVINQFVRVRKEKNMLHINGNRESGYGYFCVER